MKKLSILVSSLMILFGCASNDIGQVFNDGVNGAISGVLGSSQQVITSNGSGSGNGSDNVKTYSVEGENINIFKATKSSRDYGKISFAKTDKNPKGQTRLILDSCSHPRVGSVKCEGYIYEVTPEGWLVDQRIYLKSSSSNYNEIVIPAGTYYAKLASSDLGRKSYVTGTFTITPFVTSHVNLELE